MSSVDMEKQYNHQEVESRLVKWWHEAGVYTVDVHHPQLLSIDTPPPTVSGSLHIGHIFSYTQTDIVARFKRMSGNEVFYPFGFDDNGLPTERFVEKQRGVSAHHMTRSAFIQLCLDATVPVEDAFKELWQKMGLSVDWNFCYATIDGTARTISQASFLRLYERGFIYRKDEPSLYCTTCRTTVAQAELDDEEQRTVMYNLTFSALDGTPLVVATTRPELLPACVALLFHPQDTRYQHLRGSQAQVPLFGHTVPIYADEAVIPDKGTGLVMCCTFGDTTDIAWYKQHQLPYRPAIGSDGKWLPTTGFLAGKKAKEAREAVVAAAQEAGLITGSRELMHAVNVHERCRQPIEFLVIPQWFLKILPYKKELCKLADQINWYPAFMKTRYINWVENITWDWCLSRQRFFGIPFPAWHCTSCKAVLLPSEEQLPVDPQEMPWQGVCTACGGGPVVPDSDVMDTWNTSSLTPYLCEALRTGDTAGVFDRPYTPMGMRPQAHDIIRTWAFYTIAKTWMHHGTIPWRDIVISGHVLSGAGGKLSKSKNNSSMEPDQLLARYPADVIRFWTASGSLGHDVAFSEQQLQIGNRLVVKLWNAFRFITEHAPEADVSAPLQPVQVIHRWILHQLTVCYAQYSDYFARYEAGLALNSIEQAFWKDFCDNYLEIIKDQFFNPDKYPQVMVEETRQVLRMVGLRIIQLYAPFLPYITEELYQVTYRKDPSMPESLHRTQFGAVQVSFSDEQAALTMKHVLDIMSSVRRCKTERQLSLRTEIACLEIVIDPQHYTALSGQELLIAGATRSCAIKWTQKPSQDIAAVESMCEEREGAWYVRVTVL